MAVPFTVGFAGTAVAAAAPADYQMTAATAATLAQPVAEGLSPAQRKPKKVTVTVRCDKVKNGTPANGHSEEKIEGTGRAFNRKDTEKAAEQDVDNKMP
ncbi:MULTISPECIES: hypothetical protein [Nocardia]|uniref:hypothetical protein n=1 Tax=Nocardia abscessus TaxID=120957 RepID=UPI001893660E|nr:hypothetical protein [Nocardia abscessus]MBF6472767.1 hypothetical protein [Nocardia abscessus]